MTCPNCGGDLAVQKWFDDVWLAEERRVCRCGYVWHWSYGNLIEEDEDDEFREEPECEDGVCPINLEGLNVKSLDT